MRARPSFHSGGLTPASSLLVLSGSALSTSAPVARSGAARYKLRDRLVSVRDIDDAVQGNPPHATITSHPDINIAAKNGEHGRTNLLTFA